MKIEISNSDNTFRLVDGIEETDSYVTGTIVEFGDKSILDETASDPWWAEIDADGESDGFAHNSTTSQPVGFELDCEFEGAEDGDGEEEEETD
jgi:hypothetical protein